MLSCCKKWYRYALPVFSPATCESFGCTLCVLEPRLQLQTTLTFLEEGKLELCDGLSDAAAATARLQCDDTRLMLEVQRACKPAWHGRV